MTYQIATCTETGEIIEIDDEVADTLAQAASWLAGGWIKIEPNLYRANNLNGTVSYATIVEQA